MKASLVATSLLYVGLLAGCGSGDHATTTTTSAPTATEAAPAPAATEAAPAPAASALDVSTWQPADLSKVVPEMPITLNVPAGAKLEKNGNGGVDIRLDDKNLLTVSFQAVSSLQEAIDTGEAYYLEDESYTHAKKVVSDPNGFVYTRRMKPEANGTTYEPETHFVYHPVGKDGAVYQIALDRTMEALSANGSDYPEAQAKAIYEAVKKSVKVAKQLP